MDIFQAEKDNSIDLSVSLGLPTPDEVMILAAITYPEYLPQPPTNYRYQVSVPDDLAQRRESWIARQVAAGAMTAPTMSGKPDTQQYYDSKGAIAKPIDGDNTKAESDSCLTCINQGSRCHGTAILDGKCLACRGYNKAGVVNREIRVCRWREDQIFTYRQHIAKYPNKSSVTKNKKKLGNSEEPDLRTIFDVEDRYAQKLIQAMAATIFDAGWVTRDAKKNLVIMLVLACSQYTRGIPGSVNGDGTAAAASDIRTILFNMNVTEALLSEAQMNKLLPNDHPASGLQG